MYVRSNLSHHCREDITDPNLEILGIEIAPNHARSYVVLCWYRPPTSGIDNTIYEALTKILEKIDAEGKEIILIGDRNSDFKGSTLRCLINVHPPRLLIFGFFSNPPDLVSTPFPLINLKKIEFITGLLFISFHC